MVRVQPNEPNPNFQYRIKLPVHTGRRNSKERDRYIEANIGDKNEVLDATELDVGRQHFPCLLFQVVQDCVGIIQFDALSCDLLAIRVAYRA